ncbi:hypothetical protein O181_102646 [Austropuccinia psidii MF-1]|uniref:Uncharacterized protein n=1 Tax=Austropuccinia psidii MF-1 TaxID=1389203 RepID=A0A9Q3JJ36_9BASI|nr:hypothetical protein [Austropuccinia psidii MF-1]
MTPLNHNHIGRGILAHHPSGPQHYITSLGDCMFVSHMELVTCPNECFVQVGFRNWPPHMCMSHTSVPAHGTASVPAGRHTHASGSAPAPAHTTAQGPATAHTTAQGSATAHTTAQEPAPTHANSGSTCVTPKWPMPLEIRPSHDLPLCACSTPLHLLHCVEGSNPVTHSCSAVSWLPKIRTKHHFSLVGHVTHTHTRRIVWQAPPVSPAKCQPP